eukprot:TRINITY_DN10636_c0_g2_i2.p1 TRINITY_DN10636_c0_g2~~TRINITY_DN10636_c0_g2_i2.p1  ORF type:complete len:632 (+),score=93.61 TRINITY_DN10636_c0_g2_i2:114-2009(+)
MCIRDRYCVVGAGPSGLQMAALLHNAGRDYVVFERAETPGSFFNKYPRHRVLNTFNKQQPLPAGSTHSERALRYDQHALFTSPGQAASMSEFSSEFHPHADDYVEYLKAFALRQQLRIKYDSDVVVSLNTHGKYTAEAGGEKHECDVVFVSTGISVPRQPRATQGGEHIDTYDAMSTDPTDYLNKSVLILGYGNSAFETAKALVDTVAHVWVLGGRRLRLAAETYYEGDVHASTSDLVDSYHLKSLDAIGESSASSGVLAVVKDGDFLKLVDPKFATKFRALLRFRAKQAYREQRKSSTEKAPTQEFLKRHPNIGRKYLDLQAEEHTDVEGDGWSADLSQCHKLIQCHGFTFNRSVLRAPCEVGTEDCLRGGIQFEYLSGPVFSEAGMPFMTSRHEDQLKMSYPESTYPVMSELFESPVHPNLFFLGALMHAHDWRNSSGGFIHGYRHLIVGLHHHLEMRRHQRPWPSVPVDRGAVAVAEALIFRATHAASIFSMHRRVFDVLTVGANDSSLQLFAGVPVGAISGVVYNRAAYLTMTFDRPSVQSDPETEQRVKAAQADAFDAREAVHQMNNRLTKSENTGETKAAADRVENIWSQRRQYAGMLSDHSPFCLLYTSPSPRDRTRSRMPSSA